VGKSSSYSDCVETLDKNWQMLEEEGALALITGNLGDAPLFIYCFVYLFYLFVL